MVEIFGDSDVYSIANLDQKAATILLRGAVTKSLDPSSNNLDGPKNQPMMPIAWLREYTAPNGNTKGQAFCTTMGSSTDFADENLRRLVVNASLALTGQKVPAKADVDYVDPITPTAYSAVNEKDFYKKRNLKPDDYSLGNSPRTGLPGQAPETSALEEEKKRMIRSATPSKTSQALLAAPAPKP